MSVNKNKNSGKETCSILKIFIKRLFFVRKLFIRACMDACARTHIQLINKPDHIELNLR